ncbi:hypothetical protein BGZ58_001329 [Dissophora ornata]|nr:hypothetical protein BGZ58_001329 [Dissophora ornata]
MTLMNNWAFAWEDLQSILEAINPFCRFYKSIRQREHGMNIEELLRIVMKSKKGVRGQPLRPYDLPSAPEIAIFMPDAEAAVGRDVVVEGKNGPLRSIDEASSVYDPLRSLHQIAKNPVIQADVQEIAKTAARIRESKFRSGFLAMQGDLMRKRKWVEDSDEEGRPYDELWNRDPLSSDSSDEDFTAGSPASLDDDDLTGDEQDLTGEIPCPTVIDQFNGPGTISSQLSGDLSGRIYIGNIDISTIIMNHRRANVIKRKATNIDDYLLANFVVTPTLLTSVISAQFSTETIKEVFPDHNQSVLEPTEGDFVRRLCSKSGHAYPTVQTWFDNEPRIPASIVYRSVSLFFSEASLWAGTDWCQKGSGSNEDTFTAALLKPLMAGAFGRFAGCTFRWSRDLLCAGDSTDLDSPLQFPDYQVSIDKHAFVLGEFKTAVASAEDMDDDYKKLIIMGKKAVDGLYSDGFPSSVILIHGQGLLVDVYRLHLRAEAIYELQALGKFRLVSSPYEFGLLLGLGPLVTAQAVASATFQLLARGRRVDTTKAWMRGTFDAKGVTIP